MAVTEIYMEPAFRKTASPAGAFLLRLSPRGIFLHMWLRLAAILLLAPIVIGLVPLAYAAATDPTWVPGFWDDDDDDEAILAAASGVGTLDTGARPPGLTLVVRDLPPSTAPAVTAGSVYRSLVRAPPAS